MNGSMPKMPQFVGSPPEPSEVTQVMSDAEVIEKLAPALRLPR